MAKRNARYARLQVDYTELMNLANRSKFIDVLPEKPEPGWPPEKYTITFTCAGVAGINDNGFPKISVHHQVSLYLSRGYPVKEPSLLWLTDIWHPNIDHLEPRHVCTNAVQTFFVGKPISDLVLSLAEMVQYKRYHAKLEPPFPQDLDAARWVREVAEPKGWISQEKPFDPTPLLREHQIVQVPNAPRPRPSPPVEKIRFGPTRVMDTTADAQKKTGGGGIMLGKPRPGA